MRIKEFQQSKQNLRIENFNNQNEIRVSHNYQIIAAKINFDQNQNLNDTNDENDFGMMFAFKLIITTIFSSSHSREINTKNN